MKHIYIYYLNNSVCCRNGQIKVILIIKVSRSFISHYPRNQYELTLLLLLKLNRIPSLNQTLVTDAPRPLLYHEIN